MGEHERPSGSKEVVGVVCAGCARVLERCAFCAEERCPHPACFRCVVVPLTRSLSALHGHGG